MDEKELQVLFALNEQYLSRICIECDLKWSTTPTILEVARNLGVEEGRIKEFKSSLTGCLNLRDFVRKVASFL